MGHNMGMDHDFDESHGGSNGPCNGNGIMSYGSAPNVWSTCSRADFLAHYNKIMASSSWNWCLTSKINNFNFDKKIKRKQVYRVFQLDLPQMKCLLDHQKCTFKS